LTDEAFLDSVAQQVQDEKVSNEDRIKPH
jgi:hypothetical protein